MASPCFACVMCQASIGEPPHSKQSGQVSWQGPNEDGSVCRSRAQLPTETAPPGPFSSNLYSLSRLNHSGTSFLRGGLLCGVLFSMGILRERQFLLCTFFSGNVPGQPGAKEGNLICVIKCSVSYYPRPLTVAWFVLKESVATPVPKKAQRSKMLHQPPGISLRLELCCLPGAPLSPLPRVSSNR